MLATTACACTSHRDDQRGDGERPVGSSQSALSGGFDDDDTPQANVVVAMSCTGTLITPRIALTASHCIWGAESNNNCNASAIAPNVTVALIGNDGSGVGQTFRPHPAKKYAARIEHCFGTGDESKAQDIAVVYLEEPIIESSMLNRSSSHLAVPQVVRPRLLPPSEVDGSYPELGVAGFGGVSKFKRQFLHVRNGHFDVNNVGDDYQWEYDDDHGWDAERGDSGGPLFLPGSNGNREVIGVLNGHGWDIWQGRHIVWADITRGPNKTWLLEHVKEGSIASDLRHSAPWLARHGKTEQDWWGELDYSGPCDHHHDGDCDGWWDHNADAEHPLHDNCPVTPNPNQEDSDDDGVGDLCDPCPFDLKNDEDHDGWCADNRPPWIATSRQPIEEYDNCPTVAQRKDATDTSLPSRDKLQPRDRAGRAPPRQRREDSRRRL